MDNNTNDIFNAEFSRQYDTNNRRLDEVVANLHVLIAILLNDQPANAKVLCVGVGTGSEIIRLAQQHPHWHFTGVDPSPDMLAVCREKLIAAEIVDRCQLQQGYLSDVALSRDYDIILCLLVTHFIQHPQRDGLYAQMYLQLKSGGRMITAEIAGDMHSAAFDEQVLFWQAMHQTAGSPQRNATEMRKMLSQRLLLLPPAQTEALIEQAGFPVAQRFFQSLLIHGWTARKSE